MELFSVACITCRAKIQVRSVSAIGQVLACPRCGGMVEITAPPGWKPPPPAVKEQGPAKGPAAKGPDAKDQPKKDPAQIPRAKPLGGTLGDRGAGEVAAGAAPTHPKPPTAAQHTPGEPETPAAYVAEPVLDEDDPLAAVQRQAAERSRKQKKLLAIGGGAAALVLVVAGIRYAVSGPDEVAVVPPVEPPQATSTPTAVTPQPVPTPTVPTLPVPTPTKPAASPPTPTPPATPTATPAPTPTATSTGTAVARVDPPPANPPAATPPNAAPPQVPAPAKAFVPLAPQPGLAPASPDVERRLAAKAPAIELAGLSRREALELVGRLAAVGVQYEWDAFAPGELKLDEPVTLKAGDATYAELADRLVAPLGARLELVGSNLLVRPLAAAAVSVDYPIDDLAGGDVAAAELYAGLVQLFVAPESWEARGGKGKLVASAGKLTAVQPAATQRELLVWLDRLRSARGKSTKGTPQSNDSRLVRARGESEKPVTMNFRPGVPLGEIVAFLNKKADASVTIDYIALADAGYVLDEAIGIAVDKTPLGEVLAAICEPRELDCRIVDERTLEITTREALRRRAYVEFYDVRVLIVEAGIAPVELIKLLKADFADAGWTEAGGEGIARFDAASNRLILRHHQEAHRRIERFLGELIAAVPKMKAGAGAPAPAPAPPVPAAAGAAAPNGTGASDGAPVAPRPAGAILLPAARATPKLDGPKPSGSAP